MLSPFRNVPLPTHAERRRLPARWAFREVAQWLARSDLARVDWNIETQTQLRAPEMAPVPPGFMPLPRLRGDFGEL